MKSIHVKALFVFLAILCISNFLVVPEAFAKPKTLKTTPKSVLIIVDQIPDNTISFVVPVTLDKTIVNISAAKSDSTGSLVVFSQDGVGIIKTNGNLPSSVKFTLTLKGLKRGKTDFSVGQVVDKLGGSAIDGATVSTKVKKIKIK
jgi:hypothetical protein